MEFEFYDVNPLDPAKIRVDYHPMEWEGKIKYLQPKKLKTKSGKQVYYVTLLFCYVILTIAKGQFSERMTWFCTHSETAIIVFLAPFHGDVRCSRYPLSVWSMDQTRINLKNLPKSTFFISYNKESTMLFGQLVICNMILTISDGN